MNAFRPLALVKNEGSWVVVPCHGDHRVPVNSTPAALIHSVPGDGRGGVAGPVQHIPTPVVGQALHRAHICKTTQKGEDGDGRGELKEARQSHSCVIRPSVDCLAAAQCWQTAAWQHGVRATDTTVKY